jgi:HSP20 family protein
MLDCDWSSDVCSSDLGQDVDEANAKARFDNGVLELTLPKKAVTPTKRLAVE